MAEGEFFLLGEIGEGSAEFQVVGMRGDEDSADEEPSGVAEESIVPACSEHGGKGAHAIFVGDEGMMRRFELFEEILFI